MPLPKLALVLIFALYVRRTPASVLLLSSTGDVVGVPALTAFDDADLRRLLAQLGEPRLVAFKASSSEAFRHFHGNRFSGGSAFAPRDELTILGNATELEGTPEQNSEVIEQILNKSGTESILIVFRVDEPRRKREVPEKLKNETQAAPSGPVIYNSTKDLIYSSKPLLFKNGNTSILLGGAHTVTIDIKKKPNVRTVKAKLNNSMSLSFNFTQSTSGYWTLLNLEIEVINTTIQRYNVTTEKPITCPALLSYHCSGETVFRGSGVELRMYDLQMQIATGSQRFRDAWDCVPFVTAPICSCLFVTFILSLVLVIALHGISSIKTMDRMDHSKGKQLSVTVFE